VWLVIPTVGEVEMLKTEDINPSVHDDREMKHNLDWLIDAFRLYSNIREECVWLKISRRVECYDVYGAALGTSILILFGPLNETLRAFSTIEMNGMLICCRKHKQLNR
jgi:hypothetical protein